MKAEVNVETGEPLQELTESCQSLLKEIGSKARTVAEAVEELQNEPQGPLAVHIQQGIER